ncbi:DUF3301 domain-containing protein [Pseudomonas borbori]
MIDLFDVLLVMLFACAAMWLWHGHGIRERALLVVKQHCAKLDVELLDGNVALRKIGLLADARGNKRLARVYSFEFTVTGEQRHTGSIVMFGRHPGRIELAPHPFREPAQESAQIIELERWRSRPEGQPPGD